MKSVIFVSFAAALAFLAACASTPERVDQLEQARAQVQALSQDPLATQAASQELQDARGALDQADRALEEGRSQEEIVHLAYVAERNAQIGRARIEEARARQQVAQGEAERNRVLLEARASEARSQAQLAEQARQEALSARAKLEETQRELSQLQAKQTKRGMVVTLGDVLFDTNKAVLKPGAASRLDRLAAFLEENPGTRIIIEGHTDSTGSEELNADLSRRRAQAVADALASRGIPSDRFEVVGRGEGYPVASNETSAGRQQNRRVEIVFSDQSGKFAQGESATLR